jgi:hypothetical protein
VGSGAVGLQEICNHLSPNGDGPNMRDEGGRGEIDQDAGASGRGHRSCTDAAG